MVREKTDASIDAPKSVGEAIRRVARKLDAAGVYCGHGTDNPLDEAAWLVGGALRIRPAALAQHHRAALPPAALARLRRLVEQRIATRTPTAYLLHEAWFAGLRFYVDERVIVPRSLIGDFVGERFKPWIERSRVRRILDLGTGSGCIAIACAKAFPSARVDAVDVSRDALRVARINVERYRLGERVRLVQSDLFARLAGARYDLIVANPPYVGRAEMRTLPAEYRHEPVLALESGGAGLDALSRILRGAATHLEPGGMLIAETGNSKRALQRKFPRMPFVWLATAAGDDSVFLLSAAQLAAPRRTAPGGSTRRGARAGRRKRRSP